MTPERLLAFEAAHPTHSTAKEELIRSELGITPVRYVVLLARAAASAEGVRAHPMTARRVRDVAMSRARTRALRGRGSASIGGSRSIV
ncbi:DUF3263 domain-containing protein [Microbacterium sp. USHLN272]|uniref:DUF3263 domain-containing protein n=1 Tax=Microbacterium sp. USHLN272 TaxID=3081287 RepID=UPI0030167038